MAIVVVILVVAAFIVGSYVYVIPPPKIGVSMTSEQDESRLTGVTTMILCPSKARDMGLCNTDERDLHAKYRLVVQPPPPLEVSLQVECKVFESLPPFHNPLFPVSLDWPFEVPISVPDATSNFTCKYARTGEHTFELDLAFIADPENGPSIAQYVLIVTVGYDEPLLPWMPLVTRNVNSTNVGDVCLLGYHIGKHPPPGTPESENPLGEFRDCYEAVSWQRDLMHIPPPQPPHSRLDSGLLRVLPTIDGSMSPGEWSDAGKLSLRGGRVDVGLYAKNDRDFLYVAVEVTPSVQTTASSRFEVRLYFHVDHDYTWVTGRDVVYVYSSNASYNGLIRYSDECRLNFLSLRSDYAGGYGQLAPCLTPLNEPGAMQGSYHEQPAGHWVVEMKIPLRGEGGIMTEPGQVVGMEVGIWGGSDDYRDPSFYGRYPGWGETQLIDLTLASG
jgi:hypothetical protein